MSNTGSTASL